MSLRNLDAMFKPRSVALVGASRRQGSLGAVLARNLLTGGFQGPILPVHPEAQAIGGIMAYPDVASLPLTPDLAVIATGPASVPGLIGEFAARGTRAAIVVTSEFAGDGALRHLVLRRRVELRAAVAWRLRRSLGAHGALHDGRCR